MNVFMYGCVCLSSEVFSHRNNSLIRVFPYLMSQRSKIFAFPECKFAAGKIFIKMEGKPRHEDAHPKGGLILKDPDNLVPGAIKEIVAKIGKKILEGSFLDIFKGVSRPARISAPTTMLEVACRDFSFVSRYMPRVLESTDPIERLKLLVTIIISGVHINLDLVKATSPLNPVLGETLQRVLPDGTRYYAEQISHHPPICAYQIYGPNGSYLLSSHVEFNAGLNGLNSIKGWRTGKTEITLADGTYYTIQEPFLVISGIAIGQVVLNIKGIQGFTDHTNNLTAEISYDSKKKGAIDKMAKALAFWKDKEAPAPPTDVS